jgi:hypothetical protein
MDCRKLDFCIIGAQKSGTTALFHYIYSNPELYLPDNKEAPIFNKSIDDDDIYREYIAHHFSRAKKSQKIGTISPQYLCNEDTASLIKQYTPQIRLVAILRDPVDRAISHYNMLLARGLVSENIDDYFHLKIKTGNHSGDRLLSAVMSNEDKTCLVWGEYGRLLSNYFSIFPEENLMIIKYDEFLESPKDIVSQILTHIGCQNAYIPANLGERFFENPEDPLAGLKARVFFPYIRSLWGLLPNIFRYRIRRIFESKVTKDAFVKQVPKMETLSLLAGFYRTDLLLLKKMTGIQFSRTDPS